MKNTTPRTTDIYVVGVGGTGSVTSARFLGEAAMRAGCKVLVGEVHGMAQRGGIVESSVRIGEVYGPIIDDGGAEVLLGFEPVETLRALNKATPATLIITNTYPIVPATVSMAGEAYPDPEEAIRYLRTFANRVLALDATAEAAAAGSPMAQGTVLLGVLAGSGALPFPAEVLREVILEGVPERVRGINEAAFSRGESFAADNSEIIGRGHR